MATYIYLFPALNWHGTVSAFPACAKQLGRRNQATHQFQQPKFVGLINKKYVDRWQFGFLFFSHKRNTNWDVGSGFAAAFIAELSVLDGLHANASCNHLWPCETMLCALGYWVYSRCPNGQKEKHTIDYRKKTTNTVHQWFNHSIRSNALLMSRLFPFWSFLVSMLRHSSLLKRNTNNIRRTITKGRLRSGHLCKRWIIKGLKVAMHSGYGEIEIVWK